MKKNQARLGRWGGLALTVVLAACSAGGDGSDPNGKGGNTAPTISGSPATSVAQGAAYQFMPSAADSDGDALIFGIDAKPAWATFTTSNGQLSGTPAAADVGVDRGIVIWVSDGKAQTTLPAFDLTVSAQSGGPNRAPTISGTPPTTIVAGATYTFAPTAADADGDPLTFTIRNKPAWATFSASTGQLTGVPPSAGTFSAIGISVSDGKAAVALNDFDIVVTASTTNRAPVISGTPMTSVEAGQAYAFVPTASDADGDALTFSVAGMPAWAAFDAATGRLSGTPPTGTTGTFSSIVISVSDGKLSASLAAFAITVTAPTTNRPPTISGTPSTSAPQGAQYAFQPTAADPDSDPLTFTIANRPTWATFSTTTGRLQGTPVAANAATYSNIVISVSDGKATAALAAFAITVPNTAPTISGSPPTTASVGTAYTFTPTANDVDAGTTFTFSIANKPAWTTFSTTTGQLQGTPASGNVGTFANVTISVTDGKATASLPAFSIVVTQPNRPPTISGSPPTTASVGTAYTFTPTANDPDTGTTLTFSIANKPSWASFSTSTGQLSGTPTAAGTFSNIGISVSDGTLSAALTAFSIVVSQSNTPPTISGSPPTTASVGTAYTFTPTANDPDAGTTLTFSIANKPSWASFSTSTGQLSGTPTAAGTFSNIGISVSDGTASASLAAFSIVVTQPNRAPTISGSPPTAVMQGTAYAFQPTANDADGDTLTFSIANKPTWAAFSTSTGALTGTPGAGDVATYSNIQISVSDGKAAPVALAAFSVTVQAVATGSATLTWTPPTTNTDGSALTDLAGYKVYWGTTQGTYPNSASVGANVTSYVVTNLVPGTYFFVATALNSAQAESAFSAPASKTIL